jgi:segregation and condensation protein B
LRSSKNSFGRGNGICLTGVDLGCNTQTAGNGFKCTLNNVVGVEASQLTDVQLETLSIVAYKQPVTRSVIEQIRGVSCDTLVNRLLERNLIQEIGRLDTPGRPMLFGTNDEFLRCFGISSITDLPDYEKISSEQISLDGEEGYMLEIDEKTEQEMAKAVLTAEGPDIN